MSPMRLAFSSCFLVLLSAASACLPEGRDVEGRLLFQGRDIVRPGFVAIDDEPHVLFEKRISVDPATGRGSTDVYVVDWQRGMPRKVVSNHSERPGWERPGVDRDGFYYYMVDERSFPVDEAGKVRLPVATLARTSLRTGVVETIADVSQYSLLDDKIQYRKLVAGSALPEIRVKVLGGPDHLVGIGNGQTQFRGPVLYLVSGEERTFMRYAAVGTPPEVLRMNVTRFALDGAERRALLAVTSDEGKQQTVLFDLKSRTERLMPVDPCCWIGFSGENGFDYAEAATAMTPARRHTIDLDTFVDTVTLSLPVGMTDVGGFLPRPGTADILVTDSRRHLAYRTAATGDIRLLDIRPLSPTFTDDGKNFLFVEQEVVEPEIEGRLMITDGDFTLPPRQLNPPGTRISQRGFFFIDPPEPLVYWAHYPRGSSDLYFADPITGAYRIVAQGISQVTVTRRRIVGIIRVSLQDLTGDFVERDPVTGDELVLAHSVSDVTLAGTRAAFVVRERSESDREGLWATDIYERRMGRAGETGQ